MNNINGISGYSKEELAAQVELNFWETWSGFGRGTGCALYEEMDAIWFETPLPIIPYNTVIKFQAKENVEQRIDDIVGHFKKRKVPFLWVVHPSALPINLPELLQKRGMQEIEIAPCMVRSLENLSEPPPLPDGIEIRKVVAENDVDAFYELTTWRWGIPEEHHAMLREIIKPFQIGTPVAKAHFWLAWRDGVPVSKIGLYCGTESAGIYGVVTKPEMRGMGLASIMMAEAMNAARLWGYKLVVLDSSPPAENLYKRLGFITVDYLRLHASESAFL